MHVVDRAKWFHWYSSSVPPYSLELLLGALLGQKAHGPTSATETAVDTTATGATALSLSITRLFMGDPRTELGPADAFRCRRLMALVRALSRTLFPLAAQTLVSAAVSCMESLVRDGGDDVDAFLKEPNKKEVSRSITCVIFIDEYDSNGGDW